MKTTRWRLKRGGPEGLHYMAALLACVAGASLLYAQSAPLPGGWDTYSGDAQGRKYSPLTQINTTNVSRLKLAWQYGVASTGAGSTVSAAGRSQAIPILVRGVLYTSTARRTIVGAICTDIVHFLARVLGIQAARAATGERR